LGEVLEEMQKSAWSIGTVHYPSNLIMPSVVCARIICLTFSNYKEDLVLAALTVPEIYLDASSDQ